MHPTLEQHVKKLLGESALDDERLVAVLEAASRSYTELTGDTDDEDEYADLTRHTLKVLVDISSDAYSLVRLRNDGKLEREWHSSGFKDLLGYSSDEIPAERWTQEIIHPDDIAAYKGLLTVIYSKRPTSATMRAKNISGEYRWFRVSIHPDGTRADGDPRFVVAFKDIHDLKSTLIEKETSYAMIRAILDATVDGIEVVERGGNLITCNTTFVRLWRLHSTWSNEPSLQKRLEPMARQTKDSELFLTRIHEILATGSELQYDIIELTDGRVLERYATPYTGADSRHGIVWSYRDLTERRQVQSTLSVRLRYEKALSECSTMLFKSPPTPEMLDNVLRHILDASRVSRVYLMENVLDEHYGICVTMTHEAVAEGVSEQLDNPMLHRFPLKEGFQRWVDTLSQGGIIHGNVDSFPESEHEALKIQDIESLLVLPLYYEGEWAGFIGFDSVGHERVWSEEDIRMLRTLADMIGVYIEGQRRNIERKEYEFTSLPQPSADTVSSELWTEFGITVFRINHEGIFSHVEGEGRPFGEPVLGKHYSRVFSDYIPSIRRAWDFGHCIFTTDMHSPRREVVIKRSEDSNGRLVLDGGMRFKFEGVDPSEYRKEIIGIVSHELRTPLSSILGALKLLDSGAVGEISEEASSLMEIARNNGERLLHLLNDIIDVEKIESHSMDFTMEEADLGAVVSEAVSLNEAYARQFDIRLEYEAHDELAAVRMDKGRIVQVITNLISNAVKFAPDNTPVEIRILDLGNTYRIEVEDSGPGIPEDFQPRIFRKFAHKEPAKERIRTGAGLGLSICKAIIERHGGEIGFETEVGKGTVFYFTLKAGGTDPS